MNLRYSHFGPCSVGGSSHHSDFIRITDTPVSNNINSLSLRTVYNKISKAGTEIEGLFTGRVLNLCHALLTPAFAEQHPSRRRMSKNVSTDRLATIGTSKERTSTRVALDLICLRQINNPTNQLKPGILTIKTQTLNSDKTYKSAHIHKPSTPIRKKQHLYRLLRK